MHISYKRFSEFTVFPRVDSGRLLLCCLGAHNESFGAIGLSVAITSRYKYRMTRLIYAPPPLLRANPFLNNFGLILHYVVR